MTSFGTEDVSARLTAAELSAFVRGRTLHAFDPDGRAAVARVAYGDGGACRLTFVDGRAEDGAYGLVGGTYWTRYAAFRGGVRSVFYLTWAGADVAQAWHEDGRRAYLQSPRAALEEGG